MYASEPITASAVTRLLVAGAYSMPRRPVHSTAPAAVQAADQASPARPRLTTALMVVAPTKAYVIQVGKPSAAHHSPSAAESRSRLSSSARVGRAERRARQYRTCG